MHACELCCEMNFNYGTNYAKLTEAVTFQCYFVIIFNCLEICVMKLLHMFISYILIMIIMYVSSLDMPIRPVL